MPQILLNKKRVAPSKEKRETRKISVFPDPQHLGMEVLSQAEKHWLAMDKFRRDRERNKRYCYGDQWKDLVCVDGRTMTEEQYLKEQGTVPLKNNLIRRLVRSVLGVWRSQSKEPTCYARDRDEQKLGETMSGVLQYNMQLNRMDEMLGRAMEEFLISGLVVQRKYYGWKNDKLDCWTDAVPPNNFFIDSNMRDFRGWDCSIVGEIHDVSFPSLCARFAQDPKAVDSLREIYVGASDRTSLQTFLASTFGESNYGNLSFYAPSDSSLCRVIEVWRKETKSRFRCHDVNNGDVYKIEIDDYAELVEKINKARLAQAAEAGMSKDEVSLIEAEWFVDEFWHYYYLSPFGDIIEAGETPYEHKGHPYVFKAYPFIDGEIHSFVGDVVDQQRYVNRLIALHDMIMKNSAKNTMIMPEEAVGGKMSFEEMIDEWSRPDGVLMVRTKNGTPMPQQMTGINPGAIGINEVLNLQLKFFEDISGVNGALQGKPGFSGMSASLYAQQTQNSATSLLELLESFSSFVKEGAIKDVKNMQQFYNTKRITNIVGKSGTAIVYDPKRIRDVEFDLNIAESTSSPVYRQLANDFLMEIWRAGQISLAQLLEAGDFPFADDLLESLKQQEAQMEQGQIPQGLPPELMQQAQAGANMNVVNTLDGAMRR
ncbi:MAG: hypothetical protein D8H91_02675 [Alloprevotella sp.]|nr:MAG: hypothetical protein D8H91_02675 [Alloprevotella sp.]